MTTTNGVPSEERIRQFRRLLDETLRDPGIGLTDTQIERTAALFENSLPWDRLATMSRAEWALFLRQLADTISPPEDD